MFKITIERKYKFKYVIYRNRRETMAFYNKKLARDKLFELKRDYEELNRSQRLFGFYPMILRSGDALVIYHSKRHTFRDIPAPDFKDYYEIRREPNDIF